MLFAVRNLGLAAELKSDERLAMKPLVSQLVLILTTLLLAPQLALHAAEQPATTGKPNIVFILADRCSQMRLT